MLDVRRRRERDDESDSATDDDRTKDTSTSLDLSFILFLFPPRLPSRYPTPVTLNPVMLPCVAPLRVRVPSPCLGQPRPPFYTHGPRPMSPGSSSSLPTPLPTPHSPCSYNTYYDPRLHPHHHSATKSQQPTTPCTCTLYFKCRASFSLCP